jgi:hypothetical protein
VLVTQFREGSDVNAIAALGVAPPVGVAPIVPELITIPFVPGRTASSPTAVMKPVFVSVLLLVEIAAQSMACPPLVTWMVPLLVSDTVESVFTRKASLETALIEPLLS